jgi:hypothetical protein
MMDDPIVAEIRAARAKLMEECDLDLDKLFARLKEMEMQHPERVITKEQLDAQRAKESPERAA